MPQIEDVIDLGVFVFLNEKDCKNLSSVNSTMQENFKTYYWKNYFYDRFQIYCTFDICERDVRKWQQAGKFKIKNLYYGKELESSYILPVTKKKMLKPTSLMTFVFPKIIYEPDVDYQVFLDKEGKLSKWNGYYFEIRFEHPNNDKTIQIGFADSNIDKYDGLFLLGFDTISISFHTDDNIIYSNSEKNRRINWLHFNENDSIIMLGCGFDYASNEFFFIKNNRFFGSVKNHFYRVEKFIPMCSGDLDGFHFNDGLEPFLYNYPEFSKTILNNSD